MFAIQVIVRKSLFGFVFQDSLMIWLYSIPYFLFPFMQVIDSRQIKIFLMPTKNWFPSSNIAIRICNSSYENRSCIFQKRIKISKIPTSGLRRHKRFMQVGTIYWGCVFNGFPKLKFVIFYLLLYFFQRCLVYGGLISNFLLESCQVHGFLNYVSNFVKIVFTHFSMLFDWLLNFHLLF